MSKTNSANQTDERKLRVNQKRWPKESVPRHPYEAEYDWLTNLPSRNSFLTELRRAIEVARQMKTPIAVIILGLDGFRDINHTLGPQYGDYVLKQVAERFDSLVAQSTARARLGGDEFAAIFHAASIEIIKQVCTQILWALETPIFLNDLAIDIAGSIGVAFYPEHSEDPNRLFQKANIALDAAKQSRGGYAIYKRSNDPYRRQNFLFSTGLRSALKREELVLNYQPKIDLRTAQTIGLEALVRWNHPRRGLLAPKEFIALAERTDLIHKLSQWVLKSALNQCRTWAQRGIHLPVAVNLSPRNLHDPYLVRFIDRLLTAYQLAPELLEIEITENVVMTDTATVAHILQDLSRMGIRVYIDDFGTGFSSLGHLKKLPVTGIKIDKSFVSQMDVDEDDGVIVHSTIELGHNLGLKVIAEGVETPETWDQLCWWACDAGQGNYMSRPKPPEDLERWVLDSPWRIQDTGAAADFLMVDR